MNSSIGSSRPSIAVAADGNFVICWVDYRNGAWRWNLNGDIYAQRYGGGGTILGTNFRVNDDTESADQSYPSISVDNIGNFVICWEDARNGYRDIHGQHYATNGSRLGTNFPVNNEVGNNQYFPAVAVDSSGNFVICWQNEYDGGAWTTVNDILAQRFDVTGNALGTNFHVNDDELYIRQPSPAVAIDNNGNFVICWKGNGTYSYANIYAQRYDANGATIGVNFCVNDDAGNASQIHPSVATDEIGNFVICWGDSRTGGLAYSAIFAQRYSCNGTALVANFRVDGDTENTRKWNPSVAAADSGDFIICWVDERNGDLDIYAQRNAQLIQTLVDEKKDSGLYSVVWNGETLNGRILPSGIYFVQLEIITDNGTAYSKSNKLIYLK